MGSISTEWTVETPITSGKTAKAKIQTQIADTTTTTTGYMGATTNRRQHHKEAVATQKRKVKQKERNHSIVQLIQSIGKSRKQSKYIELFGMKLIVDQFGDAWHKYIMDFLFVG